MTRGVPIEIKNLGKRFGSVTAVSDLSFTVEPGQVTGFLGPNGAGKTTTLRILLGLVTPTLGTATIGGVAYRDLESPLKQVGASLEAASFHPARTARDHLSVYATAAGIDKREVGRVLELVGLADSSDRRVGGFSLGMRQRLGLAFALLGDPGVLVLDEPINGLDPEGIRWIRGLLGDFAAEGRTVLVSSHLLSEVQQSVERVVIISRGRFVYEGALSALETGTSVLVDSTDRPTLLAALGAAGKNAVATPSGITVAGTTTEEVGRIALAAGVVLTALTAEQAGLENVFLELVGAAAANGVES